MFTVAILQSRWWCPMCGNDLPQGGLMMGLMMLFWIALAAGVIWLIYRAASGGGRPSEPPPSAEEILRIRYARGEIGHDEYEAKLHDLAGSRSTGAG